MDFGSCGFLRFSTFALINNKVPRTQITECFPKIMVACPNAVSIPTSIVCRFCFLHLYIQLKEVTHFRYADYIKWRGIRTDFIIAMQVSAKNSSEATVMRKKTEMPKLLASHHSRFGMHQITGSFSQLNLLY